MALAPPGFTRVVPETSGRPSYHLAMLFKICLCGYLLVLIAIGLAVLDLTCLVIERMVDRLPVARVVYIDQPPASDGSAVHNLQSR